MKSNAVWTLRDAKAHLSEIVDAALAGKPQEIARRGDRPVLVVAKGAPVHARSSLFSVLTKHRGIGVGIEIDRESSTRELPDL